jgi:hypothetical protein
MLAETAERVRFSNTQVSDEALGRALEGGRLLLERIRAGAQAGVP